MSKFSLTILISFPFSFSFEFFSIELFSIDIFLHKDFLGKKLELVAYIAFEDFLPLLVFFFVIMRLFDIALKIGFITISFVCLLKICVFFKETFPLIKPAKNFDGSPSWIKYSFFGTNLISKFSAAFSRLFSSIPFNVINLFIPLNFLSNLQIFCDLL